MSFDLTIEMPNHCPALRSAWQREFASLGFDVEIHPEFNPIEHRGGLLPFRVAAAPFEFVGVNLDEPVLSGIEVSFETKSAHIRSTAGRSTLEFALQCFGAAILAKLTTGRYVDPQSGMTYVANGAFEAAEKEVRLFVNSAGPDELKLHPFLGWDAPA